MSQIEWKTIEIGVHVSRVSRPGVDFPPERYHRGMCRLWRRGLPQVNLLANRAVNQSVTVDRGGLDDDGEPCGANKIYGMEAFAWHSDEASRPGGLPVRVTAFHANVVPDGADGETHFADARLREDDPRLPDLAALRVKYQGRKRVMQRRFNVGVLEATPERKASTLRVRPERRSLVQK